MRGDTYYIAAGNYPTYKVDDPINGSLFIYIKKATNDNPDVTGAAGWNSAYGVGQAVFAAPFNVITSYVIFDGVVGSGSDPNIYGFKINKNVNCTLSENQMIGIPPVGYYTMSISNVTISHTAGTNCGSAYV